ncbi:MAG: hypothetical protein QOE61_1977 [Micromonosporaceae bacterium]|jgi:hypothetical protein|nr:hypothetical protein [Micromonosporaceae bacterium]
MPRRHDAGSIARRAGRAREAAWAQAGETQTAVLSRGPPDRATVRHLVEDLTDMSVIMNYRPDTDTQRIHDGLRSYARHRLSEPAPRTANTNLLATCVAMLPLNGGPPDASRAWWDPPIHADYLWRYVPYHLREAGRTPRQLPSSPTTAGPTSSGSDPAAAGSTSSTGGAGPDRRSSQHVRDQRHVEDVQDPPAVERLHQPKY